MTVSKTRAKAVPPPPPSRRKPPVPLPKKKDKEKEEDLDAGWSSPPPSIRMSGPPSIRMSGPPSSRRSETSLPPIEVDPSWVSLHSLAPAAPIDSKGESADVLPARRPISVRMPTAVPVKKGPPPLPPTNTIPVESQWLDDPPHDDPDAAARAALLRPKGPERSEDPGRSPLDVRAPKPPPLPRLSKR